MVLSFAKISKILKGDKNIQKIYNGDILVYEYKPNVSLKYNFDMKYNSGLTFNGSKE